MASPVTPPPPMVPVPVRRRSLTGPLILIAIGVLFLLGTSHIVEASTLRHWFAHWWPLLLILWGVIRLAEYYSDQQSGYPTRRMGGGSIFLLIILIFVGLGFTGWDKVDWQQWGENIQVDGDNPFEDMFGGETHQFNNSVEKDLPSNNATLRVLSDAGDVTINTWDENKIKVDAAKKIRADESADASKYDSQTQPTINTEGNTVTVSANTTGAGAHFNVRSDLQIWVPHNVAVEVSTRKGDITVRDRNANVKATDAKGSITVEDIKGDVEADQRNKGDVHLARITGNVTMSGQVDDSSIADVSGEVKLTGDFYGDMQLSKLAKGFTFHSSRTELQMAKLDGDFSMNPGDLRANSLTGPVRLMTKSTDIHLDDLSGELRVEDSNGNVEVHSKKLGPIDISNETGDVHVVVPDRTGFVVDIHTKTGDFNSDFNNLRVEDNNGEKRVSGSVGSGGPTVKVNSQHGSIEIRKASSDQG